MVARWTGERMPYNAIDEPVRQLCRVLNSFPGVYTYTSCGGHAEFDPPGNTCQAPEGCWYVDSHIDRTDDGHAALEFFAWVYKDIAPDGFLFDVFARAPYLNCPGSMIYYRWAGSDPDDPASTADAFAECLRRARFSYFVTPTRARRMYESVPEYWGDDPFVYEKETP